VTLASSETRCSITAHAVVVANLKRIAELRDVPGPPLGPQLPKRFLRHCDEHTIVGMSAVLTAITHLPAPLPDFHSWGVLAAPCLAGRLLSSRTLTLLPKTGAAGVSPHLIPQCSLHAMASAVSVGLGMHEPNMGVGGGPQWISGGLLAALSILDDPGVPGIWLLLTQWNEEPIPDGLGGATNDAVCCGVALALVASAATATESLNTPTLSLRLPTQATPPQSAGLSFPIKPALPITPALPIKLAHFAAQLDAISLHRPNTSRWLHDCDWGAQLEVA